jgi:hypothetical protein
MSSYSVPMTIQDKRPNPAHAPGGGIPSRLHTGGHWPAACDVHRLGEQMTAEEQTKDWRITRAATLTMLILLVGCGALQQLREVPHAVFPLTTFFLAGFVLSSMVIFVLSLFRWQNLSTTQRAFGVSIFPGIVVFFVLVPVLS